MNNNNDRNSFFKTQSLIWSAQTIPYLRPKMDKIYTPFQTKTAQNTIHAHTHVAYNGNNCLTLRQVLKPRIPVKSFMNPIFLLYLLEIDLRDVLSDVIRSPNFPNSYPPSVECTWAVIAPNRYRIKIKFNAFKLRECASRSCNTSFQCDMLEMYDGASNTSRMIGRFCANQCPPSFYSKGNALWIRFKSSSTPNNSSVGFEAMLSTGMDDSRGRGAV